MDRVPGASSFAKVFLGLLVGIVARYSLSFPLTHQRLNEDFNLTADDSPERSVRLVEIDYDPFVTDEHGNPLTSGQRLVPIDYNPFETDEHGNPIKPTKTE